MNYYEELGLTPNASLEEVREAWRGLAKLLHPDQQQDPRLRRLAECQMKRLNEIHDVLMDPVRRRGYDLALAAADEDRLALEVVEKRRSARLRFNACWPLAGAIAAACLLWIIATSPTPRPASPPAKQEAPQSPAKSLPAVQRSTDASRARNRREARATLRSGAVSPAPVVPRANAPAFPTGLPEVGPFAPGSPPVNLAAGPSPQAIPSAVPAPSPFAGAWVYVPPRLAVSEPSLYPPEFIETVILEEDGSLRGRYHARYRIADRAVSPEVRFRFAGKPSGDRALLTWNGPGGSVGEIHLRLLKPDLLELRWTASELGSQLGLASGSAVLVRRFDP